MELSNRISQLERQLRTLQIDYERFLSGALSTPPEEDELELARTLRDLRVGARSAADGFRLAALEARFNSYRELFKKRLRESEIGLRPRRPAETEARPDPREGVVVSRRVGEDWAAALFQGLYGGRAPAIDLPTFHGYLERQVETLRERTGCTSVRLRVVESDGKMKLRAKPIRSAPSRADR